MRKLMALLGLNLKAMMMTFGGTGRKDKKKKVSGILILALMGGLSLYISGIYSFILAEALAPTGQLNLLPVLIAIMASLLSLVFTAFAASGIVFGSKDMDLMFSLPVTPFSIILSKLLALYLENLLFIVFMLMPAGIAYQIYGGEGGAILLVLLVLASFFVALIPTVLAMVAGLVLAVVQSRSQGNALLANLAYLVLFGGIFLLSFQMNTVIGALTSQGEQIQQTLGSWLLPFGLFQAGIFGSVSGFLGLAAITVIPFILVAFLCSRFYLFLISKLAVHTTRNDYRLGELGASSQFGALMKKEVGRFFGTPIYLFNTGMGVMMGLAGSVIACFQRENIALLQSMLSPDLMLGVLCLIFTFCAALTIPASVSISLEGRYLWILKESPISGKTLVTVKAGWNALLIWGLTVVCVPLVWFAFALSPDQVFVLAALGFSLGLFISCMSLTLNLRFPKMDSTNDAVVVKQSMSAVICSFGSIALVAAGAGLYYFLAPILGTTTFLLLFSLLLALLGFVLWLRLQRVCEEKLREL